MLLDGSSVQTDAQRIGNQAGTSMGQRLSTGLKAGMAVGAVAGGVAALLSPIATAADDAFDAVRAGTGATGDALDALHDDLRAVAGQVPDTLGVVGQVIADLNTRTGATGETLRGLAEQILDLSRLTGTDAAANVAAATRLFGDWSIATDDQSDTLDRLFRVSQGTGIGVDQLMSKVVQFGAPLRELGFGLDESAALLGKWEREGVNTEAVLSALKIGLGNLIKAGKDPRAELERLQKAFNETGATAELTAEVFEIFGTRGGVDMAKALEEGRFSIDEMMAAVENGSETVTSATADTEDAADGFAGFLNTATLALGEFAAPLAGFSQVAGPMLYALPALTALLGGGAGLGLAGALTSAGGLIKGFGSTLLGLATGPVGIIILAVTALFLAWQTNFLGIRDIVDTVVSWLGDVALPWIGGIFDAIAGAIGSAVGVITDVIGGIVGVVETVASAVSGFFGWLFGEVDKSRSAIASLQQGIGAGSGNNVTRGDPGAYWSGRLRSFQTGAWSVPSTGPAIVHAGEMVIAEGPADAMRRFGAGLEAVLAGGDEGSGGGDTFNVRVQGLVYARSTGEIASGLKRYSQAGLLSRRRRLANP